MQLAHCARMPRPTSCSRASFFSSSDYPLFHAPLIAFMSDGKGIQQCRRNFFEILENEMRDSQLCKVHSFGGTFCFGTSSWKYRRSKSAPAGMLHAVVQDANGVVSAKNETKARRFSFLRNRKQSGCNWGEPDSYVLTWLSVTIYIYFTNKPKLHH